MNTTACRALVYHLTAHESRCTFMAPHCCFIWNGGLAAAYIALPTRRACLLATSPMPLLGWLLCLLLYLLLMLVLVVVLVLVLDPLLLLLLLLQLLLPSLLRLLLLSLLLLLRWPV